MNYWVNRRVDKNVDEFKKKLKKMLKFLRRETRNKARGYPVRRFWLEQPIFFCWHTNNIFLVVATKLFCCGYHILGGGDQMLGCHNANLVATTEKIWLLLLKSLVEVGSSSRLCVHVCPVCPGFCRATLLREEVSIPNSKRCCKGNAARVAAAASAAPALPLPPCPLPRCEAICERRTAPPRSV